MFIFQLRFSEIFFFIIHVACITGTQSLQTNHRLRNNIKTRLPHFRIPSQFKFLNYKILDLFCYMNGRYSQHLTPYLSLYMWMHSMLMKFVLFFLSCGFQKLYRPPNYIVVFDVNNDFANTFSSGYVIFQRSLIKRTVIFQW